MLAARTLPNCCEARTSAMVSHTAITGSPLTDITFDISLSKCSLTSSSLSSFGTHISPWLVTTTSSLKLPVLDEVELVTSGITGWLISTLLNGVLTSQPFGTDKRDFRFRCDSSSTPEMQGAGAHSMRYVSVVSPVSSGEHSRMVYLSARHCRVAALICTQSGVPWASIEAAIHTSSE